MATDPVISLSIVAIAVAYIWWQIKRQNAARARRAKAKKANSRAQ